MTDLLLEMAWVYAQAHVACGVIGVLIYLLLGPPTWVE